MAKICKILIIDDSALMRSVISDIIKKDNRFEVQDTATDGVLGLDLLIRNNGKYDIVLLDVNMPKMNGLEVLSKIEKYKLKCSVIMVSTLVKEGAQETILALERGAVDFVLKPTGTNNENRADFGRRLMQSLEAVAGFTDGDDLPGKKRIVQKTAKEQQTGSGLGLSGTKAAGRISGVRKSGIMKLVAIACSTGGPKTLKEIIPKLPKKLDAPIVLVQHMPAGFTKSLAERLNELSELEVTEACDGEELKKGHVYIAPGGKQLRVEQGATHHVFKITDEAPREGLKPCANIMYESLAEAGYDDIICVVLTGMGSDGRNGIERLNKSKETYVIAQDAATSVVYGMPRAIANAGLADEIVSLDKISEEIIKTVGVRNDGR